MADNEKTQQTAHGQGYQNAGLLQAGLIDVLVRGLESAKRNLEEDGNSAEPREFCALLYATPGTICPLAYLHRPT
jgi:hypothetical protein